MLDTNICSFIVKENPIIVIKRLEEAVRSKRRIVISAITYAELRYGEIGKKAPNNTSIKNSAFIDRLDDVLSWDIAAIDEAVKVKKQLAALGTPIGSNDAAIAGHAIATNCIIVTNNRREFDRVAGLKVEDWSGRG
jgi:tRNA(fMet)-specific endonuclease VapC